jgi:hypothetical protein
VPLEEFAQEVRGFFSQLFVGNLAVLYGDGFVLDLEGRPLNFAHHLVVWVVVRVQLLFLLLVLKLVPSAGVTNIIVLFVLSSFEIDDSYCLVFSEVTINVIFLLI